MFRKFRGTSSEDLRNRTKSSETEIEESKNQITEREFASTGGPFSSGTAENYLLEWIVFVC
jgi:hypothetical protein